MLIRKGRWLELKSIQDSNEASLEAATRRSCHDLSVANGLGLVQPATLKLTFGGGTNLRREVASTWAEHRSCRSPNVQPAEMRTRDSRWVANSEV